MQLSWSHKTLKLAYPKEKAHNSIKQYRTHLYRKNSLGSQPHKTIEKTLIQEKVIMVMHEE